MLGENRSRIYLCVANLSVFMAMIFIGGALIIYVLINQLIIIM